MREFAYLNPFSTESYEWVEPYLLLPLHGVVKENIYSSVVVSYNFTI
jgi:hypothetical protein